jgi:uncharacterized protein
MLSFDVRTLATQAVAVDGVLPADDAVWMPEDPRPEGPIAVLGRLSSAGEARFYFVGRLSGVVTADCARCLAPAQVEVSDEVSALITDAENEEADDPDVFPLADGGTSVDLRPAVREQWILAAPAFVLCRPECRGLCPTCGADLNAGACSCAPVPDSRWDALRKAVPADPS